MKPGEVSPPVPFESSVLLLLLEAIDDPNAAQLRRRERVRSAIALDLSQSATESFLHDLRSKTRVIVHEKMLPFRYGRRGDGGVLECPACPSGSP
jgi:hypothetical protein